MMATSDRSRAGGGDHSEEGSGSPNHAEMAPEVCAGRLGGPGLLRKENKGSCVRSPGDRAPDGSEESPAC